MKINLVGPLTAYGRREWKIKLFPLQSLTLPSIAALTPDNHDVSIYNISNVIEGGEIKSCLFDADIVGLSVIAPYSHDANCISDECRRRGIYSVQGGIHASGLPEESTADTTFIGDAEPTWEQFLRDFEKKEAKKFYIGNGQRSSVISLKEPRRNLLPKFGIAKIWDYVASIEYSRGCPFSCDFCSVPLIGKGYGVRPVEEVFSELEKLRQKYIFFVSSNIAGRPNHTKEMLKKIAPLNKKWIAGITPDSVVHDPELIECMKDSGCIGLFFGFESLSKNYINTLNNPQKRVESYETCIKVTKDAGIVPEASFMFGSDYDDVSVFHRVLEFIEKNKIPLISASIATPIPGTKLYDCMEKQGRIIDHDYRKYDYDTVVFRPKLMKPEELQEGYEEFLKELYSIRGSAKRLWENTTSQHPWVIAANLGFAFC